MLYVKINIPGFGRSVHTWCVHIKCQLRLDRLDRLDDAQWQLRGAKSVGAVVRSWKLDISIVIIAQCCLPIMHPRSKLLMPQIALQLKDIDNAEEIITNYCLYDVITT